jgi:hypothetical protein
MLFAQDNDLPSWVYVGGFSVFLIIGLVAKFGKPGSFQRSLESGVLSRGIGLMMLLLGIGLGFMLIYSPLAKAMAHEKVIMIHSGSVGAPTAVTLIGLLLLIAGNRTQTFLLLRHGQKMTPLQITTLALITILCLAAEVGFRLLLQHWGYSFG